jgi:hypothetical protein
MQGHERDAGREQPVNPPPPPSTFEDAAVTAASDASFPASDPPAWIPIWLGQDEDAPERPAPPKSRQSRV